MGLYRLAESSVQRRLAAILAADVVGYSRLMEANEEGTLGALRIHRSEFFDPTIAKHNGRIFKVMGDGFLVEFGSVIDAARCAVEIQHGMLKRNADIPEDRHILFRIGINVGDVIIDNDDVHGDGVNMATRLEGLATPGGIACSAVVRDQIGNRLECDFVDQGEKVVKNIAQPVRVYFIKVKERVRTAGHQNTGETPSTMRSDKPSIAVLPFANMSNDAEQEFFSDEITEDIITDLSKVSGLSVLSRNTVFTLKGRAQNLQQVARQLGVSHVLEGSVRKSGNRVRITAQLIEGSSDSHLWANRYDRELTDIFAVQDEITNAIVEQLQVKLLPGEKVAIEQVATQNVEAYTSYLKGTQLFRIGSKASLLRARQFFAKAVELDPQYAGAYAGMANCASHLRSFHGDDITVSEILAVAAKALQIQPGLAEAHVASAIAYGVDDRRREAESAFEKALQLDPSSYDAHYHFGRYLMAIGAHERASEHFKRAMEIQPSDCKSSFFMSQALSSSGQREEGEKYARIGVRRAEEALKLHPENSRPAQLIAVSYAFLGEKELAREWLARALTIDPDDNLMRYNAACAHALLGEVDRSIDLLEIWIQHVAQDSKLWFQVDPDLVAIHNHPRYAKLVELARMSS